MMHPHYGSTSLLRASPTRIEAVEMEDNPVQDIGAGVNAMITPLPPPNLDGLGNGLINMDSMNQMAAMPISNMPDVVPSVSQITNAVNDTAPLGSSSYFPQYLPTPVSLSFPGSSHASRRILNATNPTKHAPTSLAHCVQFTSPSVATSFNCNTVSSYSQPRVSFHFSSPTCSSPPVQMVAPKTNTRSTRVQPWHLTVPNSMPWASSSVVHQANIQFTAAPWTRNMGADCSSIISNSSVMSPEVGSGRSTKRKSDSFESPLPEKVHINEAKMAARLEEMHLDNNNLQWHPDLEEQWYTQSQAPNLAPISTTSADDEITDEEFEENGKTSSTNSAQFSVKDIGASTQLNFSDMLKIGMKSREILPKVIMDELIKPNMQVVLWKPPDDFMQDMVKKVTRSESSDEAECGNTVHGDDMLDPDLADGMLGMEVGIGQMPQSPLNTHSWFNSNGQENGRDSCNDMEL